MDSIEIDAFLIPAARGSRLALSPALEIDIFLNEFNEKSILF